MIMGPLLQGWRRQLPDNCQSLLDARDLCTKRALCVFAAMVMDVDMDMDMAIPATGKLLVTARSI